MGTIRWPIIGISGHLEYLESGFLPGVVQPEFPAPLYGTQERWGPCELTPLAHQLFEAAERVNAGLVVMDSVAAIYLANENDRAEVRGFLSALARRAYEGDRSVLLLAHPPKSGSDYSGSTDWLAGVRALWTLGPRRGVIHAPRGAGNQLEDEHLRLQVLPPIGTSSGRGRVHNRPQARRWWTWE